MAENFIQASSVHSYGTKFKESGNFSIPKVKSFGKKAFVYNGCILWNDLLNHVKKEKQIIYDFKMIVKKHFCNYFQNSLSYILYVNFPFFHCTIY